MKLTSGARFGLAVVAVAAIGACSSTGGGEGGGGGGGVRVGDIDFANFDDTLDRVIETTPTTDMPQTLDARYRGAMKAAMPDNREGFNDRELIADLNIRIDWTEGEDANPFRGTARGFRIREVGDDEVFRVNGELTVDQDRPASITRSESTEDLPDGGTQDVASGGLVIPLSGDIADVEARIVLDGTFYGDGGRAAAGTVAGNYGAPEFADEDQFGTIDGDFFVVTR